MNLTQLLKDIAAVVGRHLTAYSETPAIAQVPAIPKTLMRPASNRARSPRCGRRHVAIRDAVHILMRGMPIR